MNFLYILSGMPHASHPPMLFPYLSGEESRACPEVDIGACRADIRAGMFHMLYMAHRGRLR